MFTVYVLISCQNSDKHYVGFTRDLEKRLIAHNARKSTFSKKYAPWDVECCIHFKSEVRARRFERYLKKGSGHAFLRKYLIESKRSI